MAEARVQGRVRIAEMFVPSKRANRGLLCNNSNSAQTTTVSDESSKAAATEVDLETGLNHLKAWSLPEIADRRSAIISMPVFDP